MMTVTQTIQSPGNDPVTIPLISNSISEAGVVSAVASAIAMHHDTRNHDVLGRVNTLSITITFTE